MKIKILQIGRLNKSFIVAPYLAGCNGLVRICLPLYSVRSLLKSIFIWKEYQRVLFRIAFTFFICLSVTNSPEWYNQLVHLDWLRLNYCDLYDIARFGSGINLFGNTLFGNALLGYANWIITLLIATGAD